MRGSVRACVETETRKHNTHTRTPKPPLVRVPVCATLEGGGRGMEGGGG